MGIFALSYKKYLERLSLGGDQKISPRSSSVSLDFIVNRPSEMMPFCDRCELYVTGLCEWSRRRVVEKGEESVRGVVTDNKLRDSAFRFSPLPTRFIA